MSLVCECKRRFTVTVATPRGELHRTQSGEICCAFLAYVSEDVRKRFGFVERRTAGRWGLEARACVRRSPPQQPLRRRATTERVQRGGVTGPIDGQPSTRWTGHWPAGRHANDQSGPPLHVHYTLDVCCCCCCGLGNYYQQLDVVCWWCGLRDDATNIGRQNQSVPIQKVPPHHPNYQQHPGRRDRLSVWLFIHFANRTIRCSIKKQAYWGKSGTCKAGVSFVFGAFS